MDQSKITSFLKDSFRSWLGFEVGELDLAKKYGPKMERNYPLYPFGMQT